MMLNRKNKQAYNINKTATVRLFGRTVAVMVCLLMAATLTAANTTKIADEQTTQAKRTLDKKARKQFKEDLHNIKTNIKKSKDLDNAQRTLAKYISDTLYAAEEINLRSLMAEVVKKNYESLNEKLYLHQKVDTVVTANKCKEMFRTYIDLDSIEQQHIKDHKSSTSTRKSNAEYLQPYRKNIFAGGIYFIKTKKWNDAWDSFNLFLSLPSTPLFEGSKDDQTMTNRAAFLALIAANQQGNLEHALKYSTEAIQTAETRQQALQILSQLSLANNDTTRYKYYVQQGYTLYPDSIFFLLAKHNIYAEEGNDDMTIKTGMEIIEIADTIADPQLNIGLIYYRNAQDVLNGTTGKTKKLSYRRKLQEAQKYFKLALPYLQKYRTLKPDDRQRWYEPLYNTYLNLNMGKEFSELERQ